ncbi:TetR family transcriptional regulator [Williamsia limnetica]|uniref:TetR family transcriptional regulator n=1 Tax=Williamsia limnetica TaxID=882452 RepID=A0A318RP64_WILLI|nr:TetR/AcrR family transcriptional regulator [Williamsia limnetica]PYE19391.1 TetR family transcriptional regulator [Williamsia limnetica]
MVPTTAPGVHATARRAELFDSLVRLFLSEGFAHLTLDEIAARLRCSKSTLYTLAGSKGDLVQAVTVHFFRAATAEVEGAVATADGTRARLTAYLTAVGAALAPASEQFMDDLAGYPPARDVYEHNTRAAADRVRDLIIEGAAAGDVRDVHAAFVADVATSVMVRIQQRSIKNAVGLDDSSAYLELAELLTTGIGPLPATS